MGRMGGGCRKIFGKHRCPEKSRKLFRSRFFSSFRGKQKEAKNWGFDRKKEVCFWHLGKMAPGLNSQPQKVLALLRQVTKARLDSWIGRIFIFPLTLQLLCTVFRMAELYFFKVWPLLSLILRVRALWAEIAAHYWSYMIKRSWVRLLPMLRLFLLCL